MNDLGHELLRHGRYEPARLLLDSVRVATKTVTTEADSVLRAQAVCHLGYIAYHQSRLGDAQRLYESCAPLTDAIPPAEQARHLKSLAGLYGAQEQYCLQRQAYAYAARAASRAQSDSLVRTYDRYAGRAQRLCYEDHPTAIQARKDAAVMGCAALALLGFLVGLLVKPLRQDHLRIPPNQADLSRRG